MKKVNPRVLFWDCETKPVKFWAWRTGKQYLGHNQIVDGEKFNIICICYKWLGSREIHSLTWNKRQDSASMIKKFTKILESADVAIAQNGDKYDVKQLNTQRLLHRQPPIAWPTTEDTRKMIRKHFYVTSSSLEYMSKLLTGSGKERMEFRDWLDIVEKRCPKALAKMVSYCKTDVRKLEEVWKRLQPYTPPRAHRGIMLYNKREGCPSCGAQHVTKYGTQITSTARLQKWRCQKCAYIFSGGRVS
jgi:hypothetical protein